MPPPPIKIGAEVEDKAFPYEVEMPLVGHIEELRGRIFKSLLFIVIGSAISLVFIKPLIHLLQAPAGAIHFLQVSPGEFLFVSLKVAGYSGLTISLPFILFQILAFILPGLTKKERKLIAPAVAGSATLFLIGIFFAWSALVPAALTFLINYGADVVEPLWSIERYLDFVLLLILATGLAFQLPILQLLLGVLGIIKWDQMLSAWRFVVLSSALAGAVLTPSTDPITMLLLTTAICILFFIGVGLVALSDEVKAKIPVSADLHSNEK